MSSFSDLELSFIAIVLSIIAVYLHVPIKEIKIPAWLRQLGKNGGSSTTSGLGLSKDFVELMKESGKKVVIFYGSQTGTAEEYATRIAKEIKARYGLSSLVCNPEDYEFNVLDQLPSTSLAIFILATYGEGEPTDNATSLLDFLSTSLPPLANLKYLIFGLGNSTYQHFCATSRLADSSFQAAGATRIGPLGEGDDDGSLEEDYLSWKDTIWSSLENQLGWVEGGSSTASIPDFQVKELPISKVHPSVYQGELSKQALTNKRGIYDSKNPFIAPVLEAKELFQGGDRNCVSMKFDIRGSGMKYTTGDHVGIWPLNPDNEVERFLHVLGLASKRDTVIDIVSLDPALAKVPTPSPTTFESVLRYYLDISQLASRQAIHSFARFAPSERAREVLERLGTDRDAYHVEVAEKGLRLAEVLMLAAGDDLTAAPGMVTSTSWDVPFSHILSCVPRLQPRFYSISSSSRMYPDEIHVTVVVAKSRPSEAGNMIFGLGSNLLLNLKQAITGDGLAKVENNSTNEEKDSKGPIYTLTGPQNKYHKNQIYHLPIHTRPSKFRLPKSVKIPLILIGPGTGVSPYLAFLQDRLHLARRAKSTKGPNALRDWAPITLFYGCRRSDQDFLYRDEWREIEREMEGVFRMYVAFSREEDGKKVYVQDLVREQQGVVVESLVAKKGYLYICGDAKHMAREVEATLEDIIGKSLGGGPAEGGREMRVLKERKRVLLDVWS
ncbi:Fe-S dehydrogenase [Cadophora sp. DSE1049]|nr:Fe-S dehydrogenase [Cadophora sp. DSE1049]